MAYTNVSMPNSVQDAERLHVAKLVTERDFWQKEADRWKDAIENIPAAVKRWDYVQIGDLRLVEDKPTDAPPPPL